MDGSGIGLGAETEVWKIPCCYQVTLDKVKNIVLQTLFSRKMEMEFCFLFPGYIQHLLFLKKTPMIFLTFLVILPFPALVRCKTKQETSIYINKKTNPNEIFPWMLLNREE